MSQIDICRKKLSMTLLQSASSYEGRISFILRWTLFLWNSTFLKAGQITVVCGLTMQTFYQEVGLWQYFHSLILAFQELRVEVCYNHLLFIFCFSCVLFLFSTRWITQESGNQYGVGILPRDLFRLVTKLPSLWSLKVTWLIAKISIGTLSYNQDLKPSWDFVSPVKEEIVLWLASES